MVTDLMVLRALLLAGFPTGFAVAVSFAVGHWGFGNMYYMGQTLSIFIAFYVLLAWLLYLRKTSLLGWRNPRSRPKDFLGHHESEFSRDLPEEKASGKEVRYLRDEKGLIFRVQRKGREDVEEGFHGSDENRGTGGDQDRGDPQDEALAQTNASIILLCSSLELALISVILYRWFGIGARFFL